MTTDELSTSAAVAEHEAGRMDRAEAIYRARLEKDPSDLQALIGLGDVLTDTQRHPEAEEKYRQAIALDGESPTAAAAYDGLAAVLQDGGKLDEAIIASKKSAMLRGNADDSFGVASSLEVLGRIPDAIEMFELASRQKENFGDAHAKAARHLLNLGRFAEAIPHYQAAARANPTVAEFHCNLAHAQHQVGDDDGALDSVRRAIELKPQLAEAHTMMGLLWKERRRWADALVAFSKALQLNPNAADAMSNMGVVLELVDRETEATAFYERATQLRPEVQQYHINFAANLLLLGDYARGWTEWEWRRMDPRSPAGRMFPQPMWDGSPLAGRTILIHAENPRSLTIQFLRYIKLIAERGGRVLLEIHPDLASLAWQVEGVSEVVVQGQPIPAFEVHCPISSLGKVFGTTLQTVPNNGSYIKPSVEKSAEWAARLPSKTGVRIGIAWPENARQARHLERQPTGDKLAAIAAMPGVQLFNLQPVETPFPPELNLVKLDTEPADLHDTAALVEQMDVVVGIDCTTAHLAAAMGKKTFILLPSIPDWRWSRTGDDSAWYPTVKLFRQGMARSWNPAVEKLKSALEEVGR